MESTEAELLLGDAVQATPAIFVCLSLGHGIAIALQCIKLMHPPVANLTSPQCIQVFAKEAQCWKC